MKNELKKFMDTLDGKIDELHELRQGLSKLGVDNWVKWHWAERVRGQVRRIHYSTSSGQKLCGTYSPKVMSTQTLSALASNKHYHVWERCFWRGRERLAGGRPACSTKWLHFVCWHSETKSRVTLWAFLSVSVGGDYFKKLVVGS